MTLIEVAIVTVVIGVLLGVSFSSLQTWQENERATAAARSLGDILRLASAEAVRTGNVQLVFIGIGGPGGAGDVLGTNLTDANGDWTPLLVLNDGALGSAGQNCQINAGETRMAVPVSRGVSFGVSRAGTTKAPGDSTAIAITSGSTFATPAGAAATWVGFMPDGRPLGFDAACSFGQLGSGNGAIYITNGDRDYAVVMNALGGVRVHAWDIGAGAWQG